MLYGFCSKFHTFATNANFFENWLRFHKVTESLKVGTFLWHSVDTSYSFITNSETSSAIINYILLYLTTDSQPDVGRAFWLADICRGFSAEQTTLTLPGRRAHGGIHSTQLICRLWNKDSSQADQSLQVASLCISTASNSQKCRVLLADLSLLPTHNHQIQPLWRRLW